MSSISQCEYDIARYKNLKSNINTIMTKLKNASESADDLTIKIKQKYQINDNYTPIVTRTNTLKNNINNTYDNLKNKILPEIDYAIDNLNNEIYRLMEEENENL